MCEWHTIQSLTLSRRRNSLLDNVVQLWADSLGTECGIDVWTSVPKETNKRLQAISTSCLPGNRIGGFFAVSAKVKNGGESRAAMVCTHTGSKSGPRICIAEGDGPCLFVIVESPAPRSTGAP